jgi:hypothetical protein
MKVIRIAVQEKKDWKEELLTYQAAYHATPHSTTGVAPGILIGGVFRDRLPQMIEVLDPPNENVYEKDKIAKYKRNHYADNKRKAQESNIVKGDVVVAKKMKKNNKLDSNFDATEHVVVQRINGEAVIQNKESGIQYRRHVNHLKKLPVVDSEEPVQPDILLTSKTADNSMNSNKEKKKKDQTAFNDKEDASEVKKIIRPQRVLKRPAHLRDYN